VDDPLGNVLYVDDSRSSPADQDGIASGEIDEVAGVDQSLCFPPSRPNSRNSLFFQRNGTMNAK
jgi:hypothetical protein